MSVFSNNLLLGAGGQSTGPAPFDPTLIGNSVWLDGSADYLSKTLGSTGNQKRFTFAFWVQRNKFGEVAPGLYSAGDGTQNNDFNIYWNNSGGGYQAGDTFAVSQVYDGGRLWAIYTSQLFRDIGWYHFIVSVDTAESTAADRVSIYLNGVQITSFASASYPLLNADVDHVNDSANEQRIGRNQGSNYIDGYLAQYLFLDGNSIQNGDVAVTDILDAFTFGTNGSQFTPKSDADIAALATTAGGNSFCLDFADSADLGNDISSNNNDFTPTSMSSANQSSSTPSKVYPTFNPLTQVGTSKGTFSEGNTKVSLASDNGAIVTTTLPSSGMWYWEIDWSSGANGIYPGIALQSAIGNTASSPHTRSDTFVWLAGDASGRAYDGSSLVSYVGSATSIGRIAVAFDADNTAMYFGTVSGSTITWLASGDPTSGSSKTGAAPFTLPTDETLYLYQSTGSASISQYLFDEDDWTGVTNRPADAKSLNSANLPAPEFQGIDYFAPTLYEGNGTGQRVGDFVPFTDSTTIANSIIFNDNDTAYLNRTFVTPTSANKFTFAFWMKCGSSTSDQYIFSTGTTNGTEAYIHLNHSTGGGQLWIADPNDGVGWGVKTDRKILDSSGWTHVCLSVDTTASSSSRFAIEINGVTATTTAFGAAEPSASQSLNFMTATAKNIGRRIRTSSGYFDGYLSDVYFIDGEKLAASNFGQLDTSTNRWVPKAYSGSYNNNGFKLAFGTAPGTGSGAGTDTSGEGHDWTENNFGTNDQVIDTPSQNFATLDPSYGYNNTTYTQGNLAVVGATVTSQQNKSTYTTAFSQKSGKWWVEFDSILDAGGTTVFYGIIPTKYIRDGSFVAAAKDSGTGYADNLLGSIRAYIVGSTYGNKVYNISIGTGSGTTDLTSGGIINNNAGGYTDLVPYGIALDMDNKKMWIGNPTISATTWNNETSVSPAANTGGFDLPFDEYSIFISNSLGTGFVNFGQYVGDWNGNSVTDYTSTAGGNFTLAPPTDFKAINQDNLDDTASKITAWAWIKNRDATDSHILVDRVRGVGEVIHSNETAAETTEPNTVQRFLQRGVQVGSDVQVNTANESYVLWQWLIGDSATTGTVNNDGSIASTLIAADAGHFSIGTYTGTGANATVGHGLTDAPEFVNVKQLNSTASWSALIPTIGNSKAIFLNLTNAATTVGAAYWQNTDPTSTVFSVGTDNGVNFPLGSTYVFQCFRSVPGVCKVGSYTGNGSATAPPYVSVGFKPRWVMIKNAAVARDWVIVDTARTPINVAEEFLFPNLNIAEAARGTASGSDYAIDVLADGFLPYTADSAINGNGNTFVYLAMADIGGNGTLPPVYGR